MPPPSTLKDTRVIHFSPAGLTDSLDATGQQAGSCAILKNLIPDFSTKNLWACRPGLDQLQSLASLSMDGLTFYAISQVTALKVIGGVAFGFASVIGTTGAGTDMTGYDVPFVGLMPGGGTPWIPLNAIGFAGEKNAPKTVVNPTYPPTIDQVGNFIYMTHPGIPASKVGWFDVSYASNIVMGRINQGLITNLNTVFWNMGGLPSAAGGIKTVSIASGMFVDTVDGGLTGHQAVTGGTGSGADLAWISDGVTAGIFIVAVGSGYTVGDTLTFHFPSATPPFTVTVTVTSVTIGKLPFPNNSNVLWVRQFNERGWFGLSISGLAAPSLIFTDPLAFDCTNANQALTFDDFTPAVAAAPLGLSNQLGGIIQSLMVFKGDSNVVQITGDADLNTLTKNTLNAAVGTIAPKSICSTPKGIMFLAPDGFRLIDLNANISDPIAGLVEPFINNGQFNALTIAASNGRVVRVTVFNVLAGNQWQEYWFDTVSRSWSGPHTCPALAIDAMGGTFVTVPIWSPNILYRSDVIPLPSSSYQENGAQIPWVMQETLASAPEMTMSELAELQIRTTSSRVITGIQVNVVDQNGSSVGLTEYPYPAGSRWDTTLVFDVSRFDGADSGLSNRKIEFTSPVVYDIAAVNVSGLAGPGFKIGDFYKRVRLLSYLGPSF